MRFTVLTMFVSATVFAIVVALASDSRSAGHVDIDRSVSAIDGDTIHFGDQVVQLWGIDAPEFGQTCFNNNRRWRCGLEAAAALQKMLKFGHIDCQLRETNEGSLPLAVCRSGNQDLAEAQIARGYAIALSNGTPGYKSLEQSARQAKLGIWRGPFVEPAKWRQGERLPSAPDQPAEVCDIKGTIDERSQRIYFVPIDSEYERILLNEANGERWLCSDDQARFEGWRRPKGRR